MSKSGLKPILGWFPRVIKQGDHTTITIQKFRTEEEHAFTLNGMDTTTLQQMLNYLTPVELWQKVDPPKAGWYIAAIRSNDVAELYSVREVWFNPSAPHKWWDRCDHGHSCQSWIGEKVVAWRELPKFDKANPLALGF